MSENEGVNAIFDDPDGDLMMRIVAAIPDSVESFEFDRSAANGYFARIRVAAESQPEVSA